MKYKLALLNPDQNIISKFHDFEPLILIYTENKIEKLNALHDQLKKIHIEILIFSGSDPFINTFITSIFSEKKKNLSLDKSILTFTLEAKNETSLENYNSLMPDLVLAKDQLSSEHLFKLWEKISQNEQDNHYLKISTELNSDYENLKKELQHEIETKKINLARTRTQIKELNQRFEFLRKILFSISKVKSPNEAEQELNKILSFHPQQIQIKIISEDTNSTHFSLKQFETNKTIIFKTQLNIEKEQYQILFYSQLEFEIKKTDLDFFKKISQTLQINLNRQQKLSALEQSERLFDLAFHSSPHYILVIDNKYQVLQANLAVEKITKESDHKNKCYEIIFNTKKPCQGCKLGEKFQIQNDSQTFRVQSNPFQLNEDDSNYWIHLYENISEQTALENKFQQTARLAELGLISSSIAHELNNPLGGIISYLQIMKLELSQDHPFQHDIDLMNHTALRMKKIIEDLLLFSRKENVIQKDNASVTVLFTKSLELIQMQLKKENLKIIYKDSDLPIYAQLSAIHFRSSIQLLFQYLIQKLKVKKMAQPHYTGLVEVKNYQDQMNSYLSFTANLGPYDIQQNSNDMTLISLEKSLLDQGFQIVITNSQPGWILLVITMPK